MIPAGASHPLALTLRPGSASPCGRANGGEQYRAAIDVNSTGGGVARQYQWHLTGTVRPTLSVAGVKGGVVVFGVQTAAQLQQPRQYALTAAESVTQVVARDAARWRVEVRPGAGPGRFEVTVRYAGPGTPEAFDDTLALVPTDAMAAELPETRLRLQGEVADPVVAVPRAVRLGRQPVGATTSEQVVLESVDGRPFTVRSVDAPAGLDLSAVETTPTRVTFSVRYTVQTAGEREQMAHVRAVTADGTEIRVPVPASVLGYTP